MNERDSKVMCAGFLFFLTVGFDLLELLGVYDSV